MFELVVKLLALFAFCGGPMVLADDLEATFGDPWNFLVAFSPVALLLFGALALRDDDADTAGHVAILLGALGGLALLAVDAWALGRLGSRPDEGDEGLVRLGLLAGPAAVVAYGVGVRRWLRRRARRPLASESGGP